MSKIEDIGNTVEKVLNQYKGFDGLIDSIYDEDSGEIKHEKYIR